MISRQEALELLREAGTPENVITHGEAVCRKALELAKKIGEGDPELVEIGALLHDIGRSKTHGIDHGVAGAEMLRKEGLPEALALIVERHVGGGIPKADAAALGLPPRDYIPETIEEKIVSYADILISDDKACTYRHTRAKYVRWFGENSVPLRMLEKLHAEMTALMERA